MQRSHFSDRVIGGRIGRPGIAALVLIAATTTSAGGASAEGSGRFDTSRLEALLDEARRAASSKASVRTDGGKGPSSGKTDQRTLASPPGTGERKEGEVSLPPPPPPGGAGQSATVAPATPKCPVKLAELGDHVDELRAEAEVTEERIVELNARIRDVRRTWLGRDELEGCADPLSNELGSIIEDVEALGVEEARELSQRTVVCTKDLTLKAKRRLAKASAEDDVFTQQRFAPVLNRLALIEDSSTTLRRDYESYFLKGGRLVESANKMLTQCDPVELENLFE